MFLSGVLFSQYTFSVKPQNSSSTAFVILNVQFLVVDEHFIRDRVSDRLRRFSGFGLSVAAAVGAGVAVGFAVSSGFFGVSAGAAGVFVASGAPVFGSSFPVSVLPVLPQAHNDSTRTIASRPQGSFSSALTSLCSDCFSDVCLATHQCNTAPSGKQEFPETGAQKATVSRSVSSQLSAAAGGAKNARQIRPPAAERSPGRIPVAKSIPGIV